jgi:hypothetical protein
MGGRDRDDEPTTGPEDQADEETQEDAGLTGGGAHTPAGEPAEPTDDED